MSTSRTLLVLSIVPVFSIVLIFAWQANATPTWWWFDGPTDELWSTSDNWRDDNHAQGVPPQTDDVYITTSDHDALNPDVTTGFDPTALIDSSVSAVHYRLYVGGWLDTFDTIPAADPHGDPDGRYGVLNMTGGTLTGYDAGSCSNLPYIRVGTRGARGTVNQSGGTVTNCTSITLGYAGEATLGKYNLSAGTINALGITVGGQGTGIFDMSGGTVDSTGSSPGYTSAGRGLTDDGQYNPGFGAILQSGGTFKAENMDLARGTGSFGMLTVRGDAVFEALEDTSDTSNFEGAVKIGTYGVGAALQSGGDVDIKSLNVGFRPGSYGVFTITGGNLDIGDDLKVGSYKSRGSLVIGGGTVDVGDDLIIEDESRLTFIVNDTTPMITPIVVTDAVVIRLDVVIDIDLANGVQTGVVLGDPVRPTCDQVLTLIEADQLIISGNLQNHLEPEAGSWGATSTHAEWVPDDADEWELAIDTSGATEKLTAKYVSSSVCP
ncbi:MAG: hypothetical protein AAF430_12310 [Myxococcota bacterium]